MFAEEEKFVRFAVVSRLDAGQARFHPHLAHQLVPATPLALRLRVVDGNDGPVTQVGHGAAQRGLAGLFSSHELT